MQCESAKSLMYQEKIYVDLIAIDLSKMNVF